MIDKLFEKNRNTLFKVSKTVSTNLFRNLKIEILKQVQYDEFFSKEGISIPFFMWLPAEPGVLKIVIND